MARLASLPVQKVGDYALLDKIGQGAMGTVYKGRNITTGALAAIKLVSPQVVADQKLRMRFAQECQVARMLNHPHVVCMLDFGLEGSTPYLAMEYVDGRSLGQLLEESGPLPEAQALELIRQVGAALHWAHENKLVHRDIKPDNILVSGDGQAKLTDLGLAKCLEGNLGLTRTNSLFGTPNFMAPEQFIDAKRSDAQSDLYALAATLYMVLTGRVPFEAPEGIMAVYSKKTANAIEAPGRLVPGVSEHVSAAIMRGLRAERAERPASVQQFIQWLVDPSAVAAAPPVSSGPPRNQPVPHPDHARPKASGAWGNYVVSLTPTAIGAAAALHFLKNQQLALLFLGGGLGGTLLLLWFLVMRPSRNSDPTV
jgi:eukaryotic-like serine/threonine-protein kinase